MTTITPENITLEDDPQGEPGTVATLISGSEVMKIKPYYFGIIDVSALLVLLRPFREFPSDAHGLLLCAQGKTNPFARGLNATSRDGGVVFFNVEPRIEPYTIIATKSGLTFTNVSVWCKSGRFVRILQCPIR